MKIKLNNNAEFLGGYYKLSGALLSPARIAEVFGDGVPGDDYKVSRQYIFSYGDNGRNFVLYDWKATNLYDGQEAPTPAEFWASNGPSLFSISGKDHKHLPEFLDWLGAQLYGDNAKKIIVQGA